jgi:hypothetical protein
MALETIFLPESHRSLPSKKKQEKKRRSLWINPACMPSLAPTDRSGQLACLALTLLPNMGRPNCWSGWLALAWEVWVARPQTVSTVKRVAFFSVSQFCATEDREKS